MWLVRWASLCPLCHQAPPWHTSSSSAPTLCLLMPLMRHSPGEEGVGCTPKPTHFKVTRQVRYCCSEHKEFSTVSKPGSFTQHPSDPHTAQCPGTRIPGASGTSSPHVSNAREISTFSCLFSLSPSSRKTAGGFKLHTEDTNLKELLGCSFFVCVRVWRCSVLFFFPLSHFLCRQFRIKQKPCFYHQAMPMASESHPPEQYNAYIKAYPLHMEDRNTWHLCFIITEVLIRFSI